MVIKVDSNDYFPQVNPKRFERGFEIRFVANITGVPRFYFTT